jgi:hypothetical protein
MGVEVYTDRPPLGYVGVSPPSKVRIRLEPNTPWRTLDPKWARQLAETLVAAAEVAELEQGQRE